MKLLFDQNLSHRLVALLDDVFPGSVHVRELGLNESDDLVIWAHASQHGMAIVTQDADFADWSKILGAPPKIVWLRCGNSSVEAIHLKLRHAAERINLMSAEGPEVNVIEIW